MDGSHSYRCMVYYGPELVEHVPTTAFRRDAADNEPTSFIASREYSNPRGCLQLAENWSFIWRPAFVLVQALLLLVVDRETHLGSSKSGARIVSPVSQETILL